MGQAVSPGRQGCSAFAATLLGFFLFLTSHLPAAAQGTVHGWGNYSTTGRPPGLTDAINLKAAFGYTYVLRADHTIALWGNNSNSQLDAPTNLNNVVAISAGYYMPMALTSDGRVHVWGAWGHIFQSQIINPPPTATNVVAISGGMAHCLALRADGT